MRRLGPRPLRPALEQVAHAAAPATPLARVQRIWTAAAGDLIAAESEPVAERDGVLTVACRSAAWAQELDLMSDEVTERLNVALAGTQGGPAIGSIRFVTRSGPGGP